MIEHLGQQLTVLVEELRTVGDPDAVEAQLEAVSSEAAEQVATANARATRAEQGQRRAEAEKAEADAAATDAATASAMTGVISPISALGITMPIGPAMISALRAITFSAFSPVAPREAPALTID